MTLITSPDHTGTSPASMRRPGAAERLARWSTRHRWKAVIIWVLLVAAAIVGGGAAGTRTLTHGETGAGESGRADRAVEQAGYPANLTERVLIQTPSMAKEEKSQGSDLALRRHVLPHHSPTSTAAEHHLAECMTQPINKTEDIPRRTQPRQPSVVHTCPCQWSCSQ
jgi:hypothetical protein